MRVKAFAEKYYNYVMYVYFLFFFLQELQVMFTKKTFNIYIIGGNKGANNCGCRINKMCFFLLVICSQ